uniref:Uncharacterized protein n=1 Tax=Dulem virus 36 TaxID=3145754 RepID=A0AAU8AYL3_9CAUD
MKKKIVLLILGLTVLIGCGKIESIPEESTVQTQVTTKNETIIETTAPLKEEIKKESGVEIPSVNSSKPSGAVAHKESSAEKAYKPDTETLEPVDLNAKDTSWQTSTEATEEEWQDVDSETCNHVYSKQHVAGGEEGECWEYICDVCGNTYYEPYLETEEETETDCPHDTLYKSESDGYVCEDCGMDNIEWLDGFEHLRPDFGAVEYDEIEGE